MPDRKRELELQHKYGVKPPPGGNGLLGKFLDLFAKPSERKGKRGGRH